MPRSYTVLPRADIDYILSDYDKLPEQMKRERVAALASEFVKAIDLLQEVSAYAYIPKYGKRGNETAVKIRNFLNELKTDA
jgi:hypothetical protein